MTTTYSRSTFLEARALWESGGFGREWERYRLIAGQRGFLRPPTGTAYDERDDPRPSQRAIIWRAIRDNPTELERIVRRSRSWSQVVDQIIGLESRLREDADYADRSSAAEREERPTYREAVTTIAAIVARIAGSV